MKLKDSETLWGTPVIHLKEHSRKYRLYSIILYLVDIFLVIALTAYLYTHNIDYQAYGFVIVTVCLFVHFISYSRLNPEKWEAFRFYKKNQNCDVKVKSYSVDEVKLYSVLYCTGYRRLKQNRTIDEYKELMLSACCENIRYSKSIMHYIKKYEDESGNLTCFIIEKGKKQFLIDFKEEEVKEDIKDELDNAGDVTESESE